jgi:hypothetical protein
MQLLIEPQGNGRCLYSEEIDLATLGQVSIVRASHVEPDSNSQWWADLAPVGGPKLGPFPKRTQALKVERTWLQQWMESQKRAIGS